MKQRVLLAMSGGVDSSVAALLLKKQGYEVIGAFMKCFSDTKNPLTGECNWRAERRMAMKIASLLDISFVTLDFEKEYKKYVVNEMFKIYRKGITPNPDVDCNNKVKFPLLWKAAKKMKCGLIATGHYVRVRRVDGYGKSLKGSDSRHHPPPTSPEWRVTEPSHSSSFFCFELLRGKDESKDQSYFLYRLSQKDLVHTLFPIGELTKVEVREIARKNNFPNYDKKGTTGICFIGKIDTKKFLKKKIKPKKGKLLDVGGNVIGEHDGIYFYTIGERIGPRHGIEFEKKGDDKKKIRKWYVARKNLKRNEIVLAPEGHRLNFRKEIVVKSLHLILKKKLPLKVNVRIRHVGELLPATVKGEKIVLRKAITGVSEGQAIVFYKKNSSECLGGGVIGF